MAGRGCATMLTTALPRDGANVGVGVGSEVGGAEANLTNRQWDAVVRRCGSETEGLGVDVESVAEIWASLFGWGVGPNHGQMWTRGPAQDEGAPGRGPEVG